MAGDPYLIAGSTVLRNLRGYTSAGALEEFEASSVAARQAEIARNGLPAAQGFDRIKAIHHALFQDVYDWAGQPRTITMSKAAFDNVDPLAALAARRNVKPEGGFDERTGIHTFLAHDRIEAEGRKLFADLAAKNDLRGLDRATFVNEVSDGFARLNAIHAFREGNGRTQQLFWTHLSREAGHPMDFGGITRERMIAVSIEASRGDQGGVRRMFDELLDPARKQSLLIAVTALQQAFDVSKRYVATASPGQSYEGVFAGVGNGGRDFLLGHPDGRITIGRTANLPERGQGLANGQTIAFTAQGAHDTTHTPMRDRLQRFREARAADAQAGIDAAPIPREQPAQAPRPAEDRGPRPGG